MLDAAWTVRIFRDPKHRVDASEMSDLHRTVGIFIVTITIGRRRSVLEERRDRGAIEPRSHHDRIAIERRSHSFRGGIASRRPDDDRRSTRTKIMARSWPDRGPIVARSRPDRAENQAFFEAKLKLILRGIEATTHAPGSASMTPSNDAHDRFQWPRFRA